MSADRPGLLHTHSQFGYTDNTRQALRAEPEAVPADYQATLCAEAQRNEELRARAEWRRASVQIDAAISGFQRAVSPRGSIASSLRVISRQRRRLDQELGLR